MLVIISRFRQKTLRPGPRRLATLTAVWQALVSGFGVMAYQIVRGHWSAQQVYIVYASSVNIGRQAAQSHSSAESKRSPAKVRTSSLAGRIYAVVYTELKPTTPTCKAKDSTAVGSSGHGVRLSLST